MQTIIIIVASIVASIQFYLVGTKQINYSNSNNQFIAVLLLFSFYHTFDPEANWKIKMVTLSIALLLTLILGIVNRFSNVYTLRIYNINDGNMDGLQTFLNSEMDRHSLPSNSIQKVKEFGINIKFHDVNRTTRKIIIDELNQYINLYGASQKIRQSIYFSITLSCALFLIIKLNT